MTRTGMRVMTVTRRIGGVYDDDEVWIGGNDDDDGSVLVILAQVMAVQERRDTSRDRTLILLSFALLFSKALIEVNGLDLARNRGAFRSPALGGAQALSAARGRLPCF
jgi:hypothetical protein